MTTRKPRRTRTSIRYCGEKVACAKENSKATHHCEDCNTVQCFDCEKNIHKSPRKELHERQKLQDPEGELICDVVGCADKNFADIRCQGCSKSYCYDCFDAAHTTTIKKKHRRLAFRDYLASKHEPPLPPPSTDSSRIELNTASDDNDSLNYESLNASLNSAKYTANNSHEDFFSVQDISAADVNNCRLPNTQNRGISEQQPFSDGDDSLNFMVPTDNHFDNETSGVGLNNLTLIDKDEELPSGGNKFDYASLTDEISDAVAMNDHRLDLPDDGMDDVPLHGPASGQYAGYQGFRLVDEQENLQVENEIDFENKLKDPTVPNKEIGNVKVVSIFGNTGDGKSYTLNRTFFGGAEVFTTSENVDSCTVGVWAAHDPSTKAIVVDTEGLLGVTANQHQRTRLMLKILALSDVVIYRTRAERLHSDMYHFIGDAFSAYWKHFFPELERCAKQSKVPVESMGPTVIIFHETQNTKTLDMSLDNPNVYLQQKFAELGYEKKVILQYVGTRTTGGSTDFKPLRKSVEACLNDNTVRSPRSPGVIFASLKSLNEKFNGNLDKIVPSTFPDQYFTCGVTCISCSCRCELSMNHTGMTHSSPAHCKYQHQYDNKVYLCKICYRGGNRDCVVVPKMSEQNDSSWFGFAKYAWAGYVLECPQHGVIFRSRQHWYGNKDPEAEAVQTEVRHVWGDEGSTVLMGTHNAARRFLEGVHYVSDTIGTISAKPTKMMADWVNDKLAPAYWTPNAEIIRCHTEECGKDLVTEESKHHCRACGKGFCDDCTSNKRPVPERGWGETPVRVCRSCHERRPGKDDDSGSDTNDTQVTARKVIEGVTSTFGAVANVMDYPIGMLKDSARPAYWLPDHEIEECVQCKKAFSFKLKLHHCRYCGHGVCDDCSPGRKPVPSRGWDYPVRVCKACERKLKT